MLIFKGIQDIENHLKRLTKEGKPIGFVPTMGALHKGHVSLLKRSKKECVVTVASIFVNPTQFNDQADFDKYPHTIDHDIEILNDEDCDILFVPPVKEIYPHGFRNQNKIDFGFLAQTLEGEHRPGHFDGMAQIVEKLLRIVKPEKLFMGQKDYQQQLIVNQLIKKRRLKTRLIVCPTAREKDGLAMSSRNVRLTRDARKLAVEISRTLKKVKGQFGHRTSDIHELQQLGYNRLSDFKGTEVEYFEIRNAETLKPAKSKSEKLAALAAVKIGGVRLIDNWLLN
jgi:pantoate--beta-alanine ligase